MSEVQTRSSAPRGRSSHRTGRGGHTSRGGGRSSTRQANGEAGDASASVPLDDQGELGQLKKQYKTEIETLKELFPDWTDNDLVLALQESDGDLQSTIEKITEGKVSRFEDVKTAKEKSRSKPKEASPSVAEQASASTRGRGRGGQESSRGGRGRGDRGRTRSRGARTVATTSSNGLATTAQKATTSTTDSWADASAQVAVEQTTIGAQGEGSTGGQWGSIVAADATPATASEGQKSSLIPEGTKKSWASMLAQPKPVPPPAKAAVPIPAAPEPLQQPEIPAIKEPVEAVAVESPRLPPPPMDTGISSTDITPPRDRLTEDNLEHLPDTSIPPATETAASTRDARSAIGGATPLGGTPQGTTTSRPPMGGYATTAWKAANVPGRSASYQRRMMEQQEAVVMPGNHAVDRAAVQFGSLGLNGESKPVDVDEDREEAETRAQPPQQSPSLPRASLPPAPVSQQPMAAEVQLPGTARTPRQAPGLPPATQPLSSTISNAPISNIPQGPASMGQPPSAAQSYGQYGRYAPGGLGQEPTASAQKPYDPFSQQYPQSQQDASGIYQGQSQTSGHLPQQQGQSGAFSQAQSEYSSQFATEQQRNAYQNYYSGSYGQHGFAGQQEQGMQTQRSGSGFGAATETAMSGSQPGQPSSRFGDGGPSGQNTPAPSNTTQAPMTSQSQQAQTMPHHAPGQAPSGNYPYGNPYYTSSYYGTYMNQFPSYSYNQQGYGGPYAGKGGMYGQPHHGYGMSPQTNFEHSGSQSGGFGSSVQGRDSAFPGGLSDYNRSGSGQQPSSGAGGAFPGGMGDTFGRGGGGGGGFSSQSQQQFSQPQGTSAAADESLRAFDTSKTGPSPSSLGAFPGRSGSSTAGYGGANTSNFPPQHQSHHHQQQQQQQGGFSGYPSHLSHLQGSHAGSQYGGAGLGGLGGQGQNQGAAGGYGGYGGAAGGSAFGGAGGYGSYGRGGWGGNYGH